MRRGGQAYSCTGSRLTAAAAPTAAATIEYPL